MSTALCGEQFFGRADDHCGDFVARACYVALALGFGALATVAYYLFGLLLRLDKNTVLLCLCNGEGLLFALGKVAVEGGHLGPALLFEGLSLGKSLRVICGGLFIALLAFGHKLFYGLEEKK